MLFELAPFAVPAGYGDSIILLADAKAHVYLEGDDDDALIAIMRDAAISMTEQYCGLRLKEAAGHVWKSEQLCSPLNIGVTPLKSIETITYLNGSGVETTMDVADVRIGLHGELLPAIGKAWPGDVAGGVVISFTAGYPSGKIPAALIAAVKFFMAHLYANREDVIVGASVAEIPMGFRTICSQFRMPVI